MQTTVNILFNRFILYIFGYSLSLYEIAVLVRVHADSYNKINGDMNEGILEIIKTPTTDSQESNEDSNDGNEGNLNHFTFVQPLTEFEVVHLNHNHNLY